MNNEVSIYSEGRGAKDSIDVLNLGTTTATPSQVITQMAQGVSVYAQGQKISPVMDNVIDREPPA